MLGRCRRGGLRLLARLLGDTETPPFFRSEGRDLLTGAKYLHTRGRTRNPLAATEEDLMAACVRDDEGVRRLEQHVERILQEGFAP